MSRPREIFIAGGGITGLCCAYYLLQDGHRITVVDSSPMTDGCSYGNSGMIVPSHFIPLAAPGMINRGIRWMFRRDSPFHIRISADPGLLDWGMKFYRASRQRKMETAMPALRDISLFSRILFEQIADSGNLQFSLFSKGLLMLSKTASSAEDEVRHAATANKLGIEARVLTREEVHRMEPRLLPDVAAGVYYPGDAHCCPEKVMQSMKNFLEANGVTLVQNTRIQGFSTSGNRISGILTSAGKMTGDEIILCCGSWSGKLVRTLGVHLPLQPGKGYSMTMDSGDRLLQYPTILCDARIALTPMENKIRIGGTMEIGGWNPAPDPHRVTGMLNSLQEYFPGFTVDKGTADKVWSGFRPCSPDGLPYIGRVAKFNNLVIATGHAMMGFSLGPATGKLISDLITGRKTGVATSQFSPDRYR